MRLLIVLALVSFPAFATDDHKPQVVPHPKADATAEATADATSHQTNTQTIESERQAPATFTATPSPTAPCYVVNSWSVGIPGAGGGRGKSKRDDDCWAEYVRQAEHQRALDLQKLELERDRLSLESKRLELCVECEAKK